MDHEFALEPHIAAELRTRGRHNALAELACLQHAVVARRQLVALGFSRHAIARMLSEGQLCVAHRGVFAVGRARLTREGRWMTAVLAVGPGALLSHGSGAALWALIPNRGMEIDVTVSRRMHARRGIRVHFADLGSDETDSVDGIPVTTAARTLFDLAARAPRNELERAMHEAEVRRRWDATGLQALMDRYPGHRGTRNLRAILVTHDLGRAITRSEFELRFLAFLGDDGFPRAATNHLVQTRATTYECDFVWPEARLIVELDG